MNNERFYSVTEVAHLLGVTRTRVLELITLQRLPAQKVGNAYILRADDVETFERQSVGRPRKQRSGKPTKAKRTKSTKEAKKR